MSQPKNNETNQGNVSEPVTYKSIFKNVKEDKRVTFDMVASMNSYKINDDQEYNLALFLVQRLAQEMTRFKLKRTPAQILERLPTTEKSQEISQSSKD